LNLITASRRRLLFWALVPLSLVALGGWWLWPHVPTPDVAAAGEIEAAAERWSQAGRAGGVPESEWPPELTRLAPKQVRIEADGVYVVFGSWLVEEWGLFVLPRRSAFQPFPNTDPSFTPIRGQVYRYFIRG
jgi:hypothetical protein